MKTEEFDTIMQSVITSALAGDKITSKDIIYGKEEKFTDEQLEMACFVVFMCNSHLDLLRDFQENKCHTAAAIIPRMISAWQVRAKISDSINRKIRDLYSKSFGMN